MKTLALLTACFFGSALFAQKYASTPVKKPARMKTASGIEYTVTAQGNGPKPLPGDKVVARAVGRQLDSALIKKKGEVNYVKLYPQCKVVDSSTVKQPGTHTVGKNEVVQGLDEVYKLLNAGDKAVVYIPATANPRGALIYEVEVLDILPARRPWAVQPGQDTITTASGLQYVIYHTNKDSALPKKGDEVHMHYAGFLTDGMPFDNSYDRGQALPFKLGKRQVIPGWEEAAALLHKGDKAKLIIPSKLAYGDRGYPGLIPPKATLVFDVELVDIKQKMPIKQFDITGATKEVTPGGTEVYFIQRGTGPAAAPGKRVTVHYSGFLENGEMFDSSVERGAPYPVTLGQRAVIAGWEEGLLKARQGDKLRLVIPYTQGYGAAGRPPTIPPKATLLFDIEVVNVQ